MDLQALREQALKKTRETVYKGRSARTGSYLAMFVAALVGLEEDEAKTRVEIISDMALDVAVSKSEDPDNFSFENEEDSELFDEAKRKCKAQVAAAISNSKNNTSLSFNPTTKDKYTLHKVDTVEGEAYYITENDA